MAELWYVVDALFSHCLNMRDAILQAVRWGDPQILRAKLADAEKLASNKRLPLVVARAFTLALSLVSSEGKPNARKKRRWPTRGMWAWCERQRRRELRGRSR